MSSTSENATVLLIGASRGLGHAIAAEYIDRGSHVVATVRGTGRTALHELQDTALHELQDTAGGRLEIERVDINVPRQVQALRDRLGTRKFDLLFVNAGVTNGSEETTADVTTEEFTRLMITNALSPMRVIETLGQHRARWSQRASRPPARASPISSRPWTPNAAKRACSTSTTSARPSPGRQHRPTAAVVVQPNGCDMVTSCPH